MSTQPVTTVSPFLQGLMAPVSDERHDVDLEVVGELPRALRGMSVRNGPNPQFMPEGKYHPFDGDGMIHAFYLDGGKASYRNRWIESAGLLAERKRGRPCFGSVSEFRMPPDDVLAPCLTFRRRRLTGEYSVVCLNVFGGIMCRLRLGWLNRPKKCSVSSGTAEKFQR